MDCLANSICEAAPRYHSAQVTDVRVLTRLNAESVCAARA